jgi:hypothetical protein
MPRITIIARQRVPIYGQLRRHLTGIDDIRVFADDDLEEAGRLALQFRRRLPPVRGHRLGPRRSP